MAKLTPEDLGRIRKQMAKSMSLRDGDARARINVHLGTCGIAAGARRIVSQIMGLLEAQETDDIMLTTSGCAGLCSREPMMTVELQGQPPVKYVDLNEVKVKKIFEEHVLSGKVVQEYALAIGSERVG